MKNKMLLLWLLILSLNFGCKKPYNPPAVTAITNYLIVEGLISIGSDSTIITLSRTVKLDTSITMKPELHATVNVQGDNNTSYTLTELGKGKYASPLNLNNSQKYRLHIVTANGVEYASEYAASINTPDIDSILYQETNNGVQFYVNTHDPTNSTRYYRWNYEETWLYVSYYTSFYKIHNNAVVPKTQSDFIYNCYKTQISQKITIGSSAKLAQDVINLQPVNFVTASSGKLSHGYSFLLKQYGLSSSAYNYWESLKKNTEQLGSIFDAQPSTLTGNLKCITYPEIPVLGFISVSTVKSHRIFIDHNSLQLSVPYYIAPPTPEGCPVGSISIEPINTFNQRLNEIFSTGLYTLATDQSGSNNCAACYTYAPNDCVDCRLKSPYGTVVKPSFWK